MLVVPISFNDANLKCTLGLGTQARTLFYEEKWPSGWKWTKESVRECREEPETQQFLGYEWSIKDGERFNRDNKYYYRDEHIRSNFRD